MRFARSLIVLAGMTVLAAPVAAGSGGTFSLTEENDKFTGTDRHFTQGIRIGWVTGRQDPDDWTTRLAEDLGWRFGPADEFRIGFALGQSIYTPEDTSRRDVVIDDRPYAGWLYGALGLVHEHRDGGRLDSLTTIEFALGVVGPAALGESTQNAWHNKVIHVPEAQGWDNQLDNEPGGMLLVEHRWRRWQELDGSRLRLPVLGIGFDVMPHVALAAGNVFTYAAAGATFRFGEDLPDDYGPPRIRPALAGSGFFRESRDWFGWYLFAGFEGRAVARDIFLDGNTFSSSHSVDKKPLVGDLQAGLALRFGAVRLSYTYVLRTREFEGQPQPDRFGAISVSIRF